MWILTLLEWVTGFIPRPVIMRPDEGGFRQTPKPWNGWPWSYWPWIRWFWVRRPWRGKPWSIRDDESSTWLTKMEPGNWYWIIPWVMENEKIRIKPQVKDIRAQSVWTKDGKDVVIGGSLRYYVRDWMKAQLEVLDYDQSLQTVALTTMCEYVRLHDLDELRRNVDELKEKILSAVKHESKGWGLQIQDFGMTDTGVTINLRHLVGEIQLGELSFGSLVN